MINHLSIGNNTVTHKGKSVSTSLNSENLNSYLKNIDQLRYNIIRVSPELQHRADLISNKVYGTPTFDWLICWYNNISDPFDGLSSGDLIKIPLIL